MQVGSSVVTQTIDGKPVKVVKINPDLKQLIVNKPVNNNNNTRKPQPIYSAAQRNCSTYQIQGNFRFKILNFTGN